MIDDIGIKKRKLEEGGRSNINVFTLFAAVKAGDHLAVKQAIDLGIDVNSKDRYGHTAITHACDGPLEMLKILIELGANVNTRDCREATALMYACEAGLIDNVKLLIERGARVDICDAYGQTAIVYALKNPLLETSGGDFSNHLQCITILLDRDRASDHIDNDGKTDLIHAAHSATTYPSNDRNRDQKLRTAYQIDCVRLLIAKRQFEYDMTNNFKHKLIRKNMNETLKTILLPYVNNWYNHYMDALIRNNDMVHIKPYVYMAVEACMDLSEVLENVADYGSVELMKLIAKLSPNFKTLHLVDALMSACYSSDVDAVEEKVRFIVGEGVDVNGVGRCGMTALHAICNRDDDYEFSHCFGFDGMIRRCVSLLLERGAHVNVYDTKHSSPLYYSVSSGLYGVAEALLRSGADVNARNNDGATAMSVACEKSTYNRLKLNNPLDCDVKMLALLLALGAEINVKDTEHIPLLEACRWEGSVYVRFLLEHGAEVNASTTKRVTALMEASAAGSICTILLLLEHGAEINAVDAEGRSALVYACHVDGIHTWSKPDLGCVKALLRHGADIDHRDSQGRTALMLAVMGLLYELQSPFSLFAVEETVEVESALVALLLEHGADLTATDDEGRTARDIEGISEVVRVQLDKAQHRNEHVLK